MKLYFVFGFYDDPDTDDEFKYFYGAFSSEEKTKEIIHKLEAANLEIGSISESYGIEEGDLDEPTDLYYFMIQS